MNRLMSPATKTEILMVKYCDTDFRLRLKLFSLFNFMQDLAFVHATMLGVGKARLDTKGLIWVLSKVKIEIDEPPVLDDVLELETWPKGTARLFALRDFRFKHITGSEFGRATTAWLLLDGKSFRPQRLDTMLTFVPDNDGKSALETPLDPIGEPPEKTFVYETLVNYTDIDVNYHANNACYVNWILNCFTVAEYTRMNLFSLQINYLSEVRCTSKVIMNKAALKEKNTWYVEGVNAANGCKIFQAVVGFKKR